MGSVIGGVVAVVVGALLAVGVSAAIVETQHPDKQEASTSGPGEAGVGPNETSDESVLDYGVR